MRAAARISILGTILVFAGAFSAAGEPLPSPLPVLGVDPIAEGTVVENHADALAHWARRGVKGAVLLHVDLHDDLRAVDAGKLAVLGALRDTGDFAALTEAGRGGVKALFDEDNFVQAAAGLGIVREVVWVVPFTFPEGAESGKVLRDYLGGIGLPGAAIETFRPEQGCHRGTVGALPVVICPQERLPPIAEAVLFSLDAGFLPRAAAYRGMTLLTEMRQLAASLREARYAVRDAVVAYSVLEGWLPVDQRWAGEAIVEIFRDPSIALQEKPPERWDALQRLTLLKAAGQAKAGDFLNVALSLLERQPLEPALLFFAAEAALGHGGGTAALAYAEQACRVDRGYCAGLREIGLQLLARAAVDDAAPFFATAERLLPGLANGQVDEGILLARAGRLPEAVAVLDKVIAREGAFPAGFLVGAVHGATGDRAAARRSYDAALAALAQPHRAVARPEVAAAIEGAAAFYREEGLVAEAERLEGDAQLRLPAPAGGQP